MLDTENVCRSFVSGGLEGVLFGGGFVRQDAETWGESLSDFSSDIVTRYPTALGVVAASAGCWSPVFTGAE